MPQNLDDLKKLLGKTTIGDLIELALRQQAAETPSPARPEAVFRKEGETWVLNFSGQTVYAKPRIGLEYLAHLLANPGQSVPVMSLHLAANGRPTAPASRRGNWKLEDALGCEPGGGGAARTPELLADASALKECQDRLAAITAELEAAGADNDAARVGSLEREREKILEYVRSCTGRNGRLRRAPDHQERIRKSVSNAISRAITAIGDQHEVLGRHLRNSVRTGYEVTYDPEAPVDWAL